MTGHTDGRTPEHDVTDKQKAGAVPKDGKSIEKNA